MTDRVARADEIGGASPQLDLMAYRSSGDDFTEGKGGT
jgi:hypothetical protein